ncbi:MAG: PEGA domain-containing protein [Candidatus Levybacteria bacterium]|nr:PEGA domain-containing protein [Candidatus Levybacteria bacterium]
MRNPRGNIFISLIILIFLLLGTTLVILYARGYRFNLLQGKPNISKTGLLVTTSIPDGAQVIINGNLTTATDNTLDLLPGEYDVKIVKDGYFPWEKKLKVQKELVTKADALLYPIAPKLESITTAGVKEPVIDPSQTKIAFKVASQSALKNGIYVYDMNARVVLSLQTAAKQIANDTAALFSTASLAWTPDGEQIIATIKNATNTTTYLLSANQLNTQPRNITATLPAFQAQWTQDKEEKAAAQVVGLKSSLRKLIRENFSIVSWSPDDTKILYIASQSASLPLTIKPRLLGIDTAREVRDIQKGGLYVYDIKEDRNTKIMDQIPSECSDNFTLCKLPISWFTDSEHLLSVKNRQIHMLEYDGTNDTVIYAGPFIDSYVFPWPNGQKIVMLTDLNNTTILPNLYTISLK